MEGRNTGSGVRCHGVWGADAPQAVGFEGLELRRWGLDWRGARRASERPR